MAISALVTRGFGNGTFTTTIKDIVLFGFGIGIESTEILHGEGKLIPRLLIRPVIRRVISPSSGESIPINARRTRDGTVRRTRDGTIRRRRS